MKRILLVICILVLTVVPAWSVTEHSFNVTLADATAVSDPTFIECMDFSNSITEVKVFGAGTDTFAIIDSGSHVTTFTHDGLVGDATTQYDMSNPSGTTFRYTYDGTGTDPGITATKPVPGQTVIITGFAAANNGTYTVTGSGTNYIEVSSLRGDATDDNQTGVTINTMEIYGTEGGVDSLVVNWTAVLGTPSGTATCYLNSKP